MTHRATLSDIPGLVSMGERFHAMSPHHGMGEYDRTAVSRMLRFMIANDNCLVLTNGTGAIGGVVAPVFFDPSKMMMEESFWYAGKGGRDLLKAFCAEARLMGADFILLSTLEDDRIKGIDRVVGRMGFAPMERRYIKELA